MIILNCFYFLVTSPQIGSKDTFVTLFSGHQTWILIPTSEKKDLEKIVPCDRNLWIKSVYPKIKNQIGIYDRSIKEFTLSTNQVILTI